MENKWKAIDKAPHDRPILLAGKWDGFGQSGEWDFEMGQWLVNRFPFVGNSGPTHWMIPEPPNGN